MYLSVYEIVFSCFERDISVYRPYGACIMKRTINVIRGSIACMNHIHSHLDFNLILFSDNEINFFNAAKGSHTRAHYVINIRSHAERELGRQLSRNNVNLLCNIFVFN